MGRIPLVVLIAAVIGLIRPLHAQLVRGQVIDSVTGTPVPGSVVILTASSGADADRTVSDARGFYLLRAPAPGRYRLIVQREGYRRSAFPPFALPAEGIVSFVLLIASVDAMSDLLDQPILDLAAGLCPDAVAEGLPVIVGRVTDAVDGEPVTGARIHLSVPINDTPTGDSAGEPPVLTDGRGRYAVCGAPTMTRISLHAVDSSGISSFEAVMFGTGGVFAGGVFRPMPQLLWRQDLELFSPDQRETTLTGSVSDTSGNPLAGATVEIVGTPYQTRTNASGRFEFAGLTRGDVRVQARQIGYAPAEFDLTLQPGEAARVPDEMLALSVFPVRLRDIIVTGEGGGWGPRIEAFLLRRETRKRGRFAVPRDWATMRDPTIPKILERIRAFRFQRSGCEGYWTFVDGVYVPPFAAVDAIADLRRIVGIETYADALDAPPRYRRQLCGGVLLIWTR
jgi:hypothetical protein